MLQSLLLLLFLVIAGLATWISYWPERRYRRELAARAPLSHAEGLEVFYPGNDVPADIPIRLRAIYAGFFEIEPSKLRPDDRPPEYVDLDISDLVSTIETEFAVTITDSDAEHIDGSFDSIVQYLAKRVSPASFRQSGGDLSGHTPYT